MDREELIEYFTGGDNELKRSYPIHPADIPDELWSDKEFVLAALRYDMGLLGHVSNHLLVDDVDITYDAVMILEEVVENNVYPFLLIKLGANRQFILSACCLSASALNFATPELKDDRELVLEAVREFGAAFEYASERLRGDREIAFKALETQGYVYDFASEELRADPLIQAAMGYIVDPEKLYLAAYNEIKNDEYDEELFGRALAEAEGNIEEAKNKYVKMRVEQFSEN
jgi:hypothetical protein